MRGRALTWLVTGGYVLPFLLACYEWWHRRQVGKPQAHLTANPW